MPKSNAKQLALSPLAYCHLGWLSVRQWLSWLATAAVAQPMGEFFRIFAVLTSFFRVFDNVGVWARRFKLATPTHPFFFVIDRH